PHANNRAPLQPSRVGLEPVGAEWEHEVADVHRSNARRRAPHQPGVDPRLTERTRRVGPFNIDVHVRAVDGTILPGLASLPLRPPRGIHINSTRRPEAHDRRTPTNGARGLSDCRTSPGRALAERAKP